MKHLCRKMKDPVAFELSEGRQTLNGKDGKSLALCCDIGTRDKHIIRHNEITLPHTTHADQGFLIIPVFCYFPPLTRLRPEGRNTRHLIISEHSREALGVWGDTVTWQTGPFTSHPCLNPSGWDRGSGSLSWFWKLWNRSSITNIKSAHVIQWLKLSKNNICCRCWYLLTIMSTHSTNPNLTVYKYVTSNFTTTWRTCNSNLHSYS